MATVKKGKDVHESDIAYVSPLMYIGVLVGVSAVAGWILRKLVGPHDPLDSPNATSMGITRSDQFSYIVKSIPSSIELGLAVVGTFLLVTLAVLHFRNKSRRGGNGAVLAIAVFAGLVLAMVWASVTYGTVDANIGGGLAMIVGLPFAVLLAAAGLLMGLSA